MAERPPIEGLQEDVDTLDCAPNYGGLPRDELTETQARELVAIAAAHPGTAEETFNRWFQQKQAETDPAAQLSPYSSYYRMFHELTPYQQALLARCPGVVDQVTD